MVIYLFKVRNSFLNITFPKKRFYELVQVWLRHHKTRKQLKLLSDEQLLDVGLSREEAYCESLKAFWED